MIPMPEIKGRFAKQVLSLLAQIPDELKREDLAEKFEERAAICEFEAGMTREAAERFAFDEFVGAWERARAG